MKKFNWLFLLIWVFVLLQYSCSDSSTSTDTQPEIDENTILEEIDSNGGIIQSPDGTMQIHIPEGAIEGRGALKIKKLNDQESPELSDAFLSSSFMIELTGTNILNEVEIIFDVPAFENKSESYSPSSEQARVVVWSDDFEVWIEPEQNISQEGDKITVKTSEFSIWNITLIPRWDTPKTIMWGLGRLATNQNGYTDRATLESIIEQSFKTWEEETQKAEIKFEKTSDLDNADIVLDFDDLSLIRNLIHKLRNGSNGGFAGNRYNNGKRYVRIVFNDDIAWGHLYGDKGEEPLDEVALHEIGHALGLWHPCSNCEGPPIMASIVGGIWPRLYEYDINHFRERYNIDQRVISDIDNNTYETVTIGEQVWIAENLKTGRYLNGDTIPTNLTRDQWGATSEGAAAVFPFEHIDGINSIRQMVNAYGRLYNWYAVDDSRGLCPDGWRVPSNADWVRLIDIIRDTNSTQRISGAKLKSRRQVNSPLGIPWATNEHPRWNDRDGFYGTDDFGFGGLPGGHRFGDINMSDFLLMGYRGNWWAADDYNRSGRVYTLSTAFYSTDADKKDGYSVRCIMN